MYNFTDLKKYVENTFQIDVDRVTSKFEPPPKIRIEIPRHEFDEKIEVSDEGIFYISEDGKKVKGFLYIPIFDPFLWQSKGWNTMPRFHISNCTTIKSQRNRRNFDGHYVFSNQAVTDLVDVDGISKDIFICKNCFRIAGLDDIVNSTEYVENYLEDDEYSGYYNEDDLPKEILVDDFGYTPDWQITSRLYRIKKHFTCEKCGIKLNENYSDGYYLETHHINGNKSDNNDYNLKCLCTLCHAYNDSNHYQNFHNYKNKTKLNQFVSLFEEKLRETNNPYLEDFKNNAK